MNRFLLIIALIFFAFWGNCQDLIVTNPGDTLKCKILKSNNDIFQIHLNGKDTIIERNKVRFFYEDISIMNLKKNAKDYHWLKPSFFGGYSKMFINSDSGTVEYKTYLKRLSVGNHMGGQLCFYPFKHYGFGINYTYFNTKNTLNNFLFVFTNGYSTFGSLSDNITVNTVAFVFEGEEYFFKNHATFHMGACIGISNYNEKVDMLNYSFHSWSNGIALSYNLGVNVFVLKSLSLGLNLGLYYTEYNKLFIEGDPYMIENFGVINEYSYDLRIDYSANIKYYLFSKRITKNKSL